MPTKELFKRLLITLGVIVFCRLSTYVPVLFLDAKSFLGALNTQNADIFTVINIFSGGSMLRRSIFSLGVMPYITSSIIINLWIYANESLSAKRQEGDRDFISKVGLYTRVFAALICIMQSTFVSYKFYASGSVLPGVSFYTFIATSVILMLFGTMSLIWIGDFCSSNGVGNGISVIIFSGLVSEMVKGLSNLLESIKNGSIDTGMGIIELSIFIGTLLFVVFVEISQRVIYVQYPRQMHHLIGMGKDPRYQNFLPLKINISGVMPPIFASAIIFAPIALINLLSYFDYFLKFSIIEGISNFIRSNLGHGSLFFIILYSSLIFAFSFFYASMSFNSKDVSQNLKKSNVFIPGYRPGKQTEDFLNKIVMRLACLGGIYLVIICSLPEILVGSGSIGTIVGSGTLVLIMVSVVLDTISAIQSSIMYSKQEKSVKKYQIKM